jgi:soluble lytic murein transglycosylase-like protein
VAALKVALGGALLLVAAPLRADPIDRWRPFIYEASNRFGVPIAWIEQVMRAESRGLPEWQGHPITSRAGAMGLMQLMPATWAAMRSRLGLGRDPYATRDNILAGTLYLRLMYERFGYPGLFGAYNAGPGRYGQYVAQARPLPGETSRYLTMVSGPAAVPSTWPGRSADSLFFVQQSESAEAAQQRANSLLFVSLSTDPNRKVRQRGLLAGGNNFNGE